LEHQKQLADRKLLEINVKLADHKAQEEVARAHLQTSIASTAACQELFDAAEGERRHAALCTALAEEVRAELSRKRQREDEDDEDSDEDSREAAKDGQASNHQANGKASTSKPRTRAGKAK
jgi:hypothetical protein